MLKLCIYRADGDELTDVVFGEFIKKFRVKPKR